MWRRAPLSGARLVCVSSFAAATYSGMLPGTLSGQYPPGKLEIDLRSLAHAARAELVVEPARNVDMETQTVRFEDHEPVPFDVLSVGAGSVPNRAGIDASAAPGSPSSPCRPLSCGCTNACRSCAGRAGRHPGGGHRRRRGRHRDQPVPALVPGPGVGGRAPYAISIVDAGERIGGGLSPRALRKVEALVAARGVRGDHGHPGEHGSTPGKPCAPTAVAFPRTS